MKTNKIKSIWEAIKSESAGVGFRRIDAEHILDFYLGLDSLGRFTLLLVTQKKPDINFELQSVKIHTALRDDGQWSLLLILEKPELFELFLLFCEDLVESSRQCNKKNKGLPFVLARLMSWRLLFERGSIEFLTEGQLRGLSGELLHLKTLIGVLGTTAAVQSWKGPDRAAQDFQFEKAAWEVKTIWPSTYEITIASEQQLDYTHRELQLVIIELESASENAQFGFTLNQLVQEIRETLKSDFEVSSTFEKKLLKSGYLKCSEYDTKIMIACNTTNYKVEAGFPCLLPQNLPRGIDKVSYKLNLNYCTTFRI